MSHSTKSATLNLCLGLRSEREEVCKLIKENDIDILCMQETEVPKHFPVNILTFKGYHFGNENINCKSRCGIYAETLIKVTKSNGEIENISKHYVPRICSAFNSDSQSHTFNACAVLKHC